MAKKVLIAEDYEDTRKMMCVLLRLQGYDVVEATNGGEAVEIAARELPDLIIMDISMPVMDGFEATSLLKTREDTQHIPIVALSAHLNNGDWRMRIKEVGADECLDKPIDIQMLKQTMRQYVPTLD